jgi:hypothetical protein
MERIECLLADFAPRFKVICRNIGLKPRLQDYRAASLRHVRTLVSWFGIKARGAILLHEKQLIQEDRLKIGFGLLCDIYLYSPQTKHSPVLQQLQQSLPEGVSEVLRQCHSVGGIQSLDLEIVLQKIRDIAFRPGDGWYEKNFCWWPFRVGRAKEFLLPPESRQKDYSFLAFDLSRALEGIAALWLTGKLANNQPLKQAAANVLADWANGNCWLGLDGDAGDKPHAVFLCR